MNGDATRRSGRGLTTDAASHRSRTRGASPFAASAPGIALALVYAALVGVYVVAGGVLPGDRWLAVHLFTLGVLTNLVLVFSEHFARTLTRTPGERPGWWLWVINLGVVGVLFGVASGTPAIVAAGATVVTAAVFLAYRRLRAMRRAAIGPRFVWIVRIYERAHGSFIHGAVLGALLGTGVVTGPWYGSTLLAHLHANVLGFGGLTLLATLAFFGPTMGRTRIEPGADDTAARVLRHGATGLTIGVLSLLATGLSGAGGMLARVVAAAGLAVFAWAATAVCLPVARAVWAGRATASRPPILALCAWFVLAVWLDVLVIATGGLRWLDGLGVLLLAGVLAQAIYSTLVYLAPMLRGRSTEARAQIAERLERGARLRTVVFNIGVLVVSGAAVGVVEGVFLASAGWALILLVLLVAAVTAARPVTLEA